ncbi:dipeptidase [Winogradskyella thalassocola]|uniref:Membrane dipeptidase n=1 Tax=Winogradskyella thalassocola TaxID=262004 RepID=A0A1G8E655_9FLAO|nr:dipeptidase [Winogradskyella thalassocola]SDH65426.1 membrane dipeptidase [Winogradskyella thalassocola]
MYKKSILYFSLILMITTSCKPEPTKEDNLIAKAKAIHKRVITLDTHCDINVKNFTDSLNYTQELDTQITLPKMKAGGLDVAWFIVYTGQDSLNDAGYKKAYDNAMSKFKAIHKLVEDIAPNDIELAVTSDDVRRINAKGKKIAMIGIENGYPIGLDISNVEKFYNLGARYMSLSHNGHSQLCDSNTGEADDVWLNNGLSDLGKQVVSEMNRLGMMIDVSHPSKESMKQMIELSKAPIIASHSSARALCNHSRNLDDEQLGWLKENGGVVQTVAFTSYLNTEKVDARDKALNEIEKRVMDSLGAEWMPMHDIGKLPNGDDKDAYIQTFINMRTIVKEKAKSIKDLPPAVDVTDFVNHIDYLVEKIGIDHVGISSDFDGGGGIEGWSDASETFNVTLELVKRGYTENQIEQLWSGNLLRVLDEVEAVAKDIQSES